MNANAMSRAILSCLGQHAPRPVKLADLAAAVGVDEANVSRNLFYLEEKKLVTLASGYFGDNTFPQIYMIRLTSDGKRLADAPAELASQFPLAEPKPSPAATEKRLSATYRQVLTDYRDAVEADSKMHPATRKALLTRLDYLIDHPSARKRFTLDK